MCILNFKKVSKTIYVTKFFVQIILVVTIRQVLAFKSPVGGFSNSICVIVSFSNSICVIVRVIMV